MLKKIIPLFLTLCMVIGLSIPVSATGYTLDEDSAAVSGEVFGPVTDVSADSDTATGITANTGTDTTTNTDTGSSSLNGSMQPILNDSVAGNTAQLRTINAQTSNAQTASEDMETDLHTFDGTNADGSLYQIPMQEANIVENNSKYNGMAAGPVSEAPAASKFSTMRIKLSPDIAGTKYEEAAELLGALGIMVGDAEDGAFRPSDPIIRSEMAKVAVYSVGLEDIAVSSNGATRFPDVPLSHWATGAINVADQQGMVVGDDVGTFRPDDPVLLQEAVAIIVRAMGYEPAATDRGGYPAGYLYIASSNQLLRGISGVTSEPATRGDIAQLIFNSLTVNLMEQVGFGADARYEVVDKTLLYDKLNVEKSYGQIVGTGETTLTGGNTTAEDRIQIGDEILFEGDTNAKQLLGYNVLYYARIDKTTDEKTLINLREQSNKNKAITVVANDIVTVTGDVAAEKTFEYWASETDRNTKTVQIAADASIIYNGKFKAGVTAEQLKPVSGNVTLLDADTNGIYEIVFVNHFTNIVVDTVSTVTGRVTDKYMNGSLVFDEEDTEIMSSLIKDGNEITVSDLVEWNVISYTVSEDNLLVKGYVSDASINGTVTEITSKGYRIGSSTEQYQKAASYPNDINLRDRGTFYLDIEGNIAAVDENANVDSEVTAARKYAYLVGAAMTDNLLATAQFKLFTATGETTILTGSDRIRFNDTYGQAPEDVITSLGGDSITPQLIVYETNSQGNITAIETATDNTSTGAPNKNDFTLNIVGNDMVYKSASSKLGNVGVSDQTIIFDIPADADTDTTKYSIRTRTSLSNDTSYDARIYDLQENYVANVIIITSSTGTTTPESPILVVDYLSETQNEDFEITDRLYGWQDGKQIDLLAADRSVLLKSTAGRADTTPLTQGDIIQYRLNAAGEIDGITLLFDSAAKATEFSTDITNDLTVVYGRVTKKFSGSVNVSVNDDIRNFATGDAVVYLYDSTRTSNNIQVVSAADIEIFEEGNEARLFLRVYEDQVREMVIVR